MSVTLTVTPSFTLFSQPSDLNLVTLRNRNRNRNSPYRGGGVTHNRYTGLRNKLRSAVV